MGFFLIEPFEQFKHDTLELSYKISKNRKEVRLVTLRFLFGWLPFLCRPVTASFPQLVVVAMELETSIPILLFGSTKICGFGIEF
ncbi:unnamed protein product [Cuscuta campestris]|uniref:Uncharacterized protein n=1 Tax=Cuscuta campestris TaxID=132261 RepID=A0A484KLW8_9ASTE|nr:unnamed protein product [Cuscuta campestris]